MKVEDLDPGDTITVETPYMDGLWHVSDVDEADIGIVSFPLATVVQDSRWRVLVGGADHPNGLTVEVQDQDGETLDNVKPDGIKVV